MPNGPPTSTSNSTPAPSSTPPAMSTTAPPKVNPPGQTRPITSPTSTGKVPFSYSPTGLKGETAFKIWGTLKPSTTPLICLHGGPGFTHNYLLPISHIHSDFSIPVILYDQIGCGDSTRFPSKRGDKEFWTPQLFMAELENLKEHLGIGEFDLLGQSWGGMLAGQYAIEMQPKGLRKLVISDSPTDMKVWVQTADRLRKALPKDVQETLDRCEREGKTDTEEYEAAVGVFYSRHVCRLEDWPKELTDCLAAVKEDDTVYWTMNGPSEFYVIGNLKNWSITDGLDKITQKTCPGGMMVINAYYDEAQDETTSPYFWKPSCKTFWKTYPLSSHLPMLEETEDYVRDLGAFLTQ